jgi:hypothetical protein
MNKIIASVGLVALSAASVQAQFAPGLTPLETSKPWSLSASLRGFYDDNYLTLPKSYPTFTGVGHPEASWGTEITPSIAVNHSAENTLVTASYVYDLRWYENHSTIDQSHQFNAHLEHAFSERYNLKLNESFVVAQEPTVIDTTVISEPLRVEGNNVRNTGQIDFTDSLTKNFDLHLGYGNTIYAYQQTARSVIGYGENGNGTGSAPLGPYAPQPSRSALLDRMEQLATLDLRWKATPETTGVLGYQFGHTDYTAPEYIIFSPDPAFGGYHVAGAGPGYKSDIRNDYSHFLFVGADESFTPDLNGSVRVGAEYVDYYKFHTSRLSPYVDASITDQYQPGCSAQLGVKHVHNATDVVGVTGTSPVLDEQSTAIYLSDTHKLTDRLTLSLMGQAQLSTFVGGGSTFNGKEDQFFILQVNFAYHFNPWLMAEAGYDFSRLKSDLPDRAYTRDFMYVGFRATY